jgi:O-antigen ligase
MARWAVVLMCFSLSTSRSLFSLAGILVLMGLIVEGKWQEKWALLKQNTPALTVIVMLAWFYLTALWTQGNPTTLDYGASVHWKLLLIPAIVVLIVDERWQTRCWQGFAAGMLVLLAHVYAVNFIDLPWISSNDPTQVFYNPLPQSVGLSIFCALCLSRLVSPGARSHKYWLATAFIAASFAVLSISQQRLGYLMWAVGCLLVLIVQLQPRHRVRSLLLTSAVFLAIFASNGKMQDRFGLAVKEVQAYHFENNYTAVGGRLHMWYTSLRAINRAPMLGHGMGSYPVVAEAYFQDDKMCIFGCRHPHNQYLFYAVEFGFIGLSLFLLMLYRAFSRHRAFNTESTMPLVVLTVFVLSGLVDTTLWYRGFVYLFVPLLGLSMLSTRSGNSTPHQPS